ncbi:MAG: MFS transporter [Lactovum sp.]
MILISCLINIFISSMIYVALPVTLLQSLHLSEKIYGLSQTIIAIAALLAASLSMIFSDRFKMKKLYFLFFLLTLSLLPLFIAMTHLELRNYPLILLSAFLVMFISTLISIQILAYIQRNTDKNF